MAIKKIEIRTCDICGKAGAKNYSALAYRTFDSDDGKCFYERPQFEFVNLDMCEECAIRSTSLHSIGVCNEKYEIKIYIKDGEIDV